MMPQHPLHRNRSNLPSLVRLIKHREIGYAFSHKALGQMYPRTLLPSPPNIKGMARSLMVRQLHLDDSIDFQVHGNQNVTAVACDSVEHRYILAGLSFGSLQVFDLQQTSGPSHDTNPDDTRLVTSFKSLAVNARAHNHMIISTQWWPVDNGIFITAGCDGLVKLWDANEMCAVWSFNLQRQGPRQPVHSQARRMSGGAVLYDAKMSNIAVEHMLIATATKNGSIRLCDPRSGSGTHTLVGHKSPVLSLSWSPTTPFALASGSVDRGVRIWDIRRSGLNACVLALDQTCTAATLHTKIFREQGDGSNAHASKKSRKERRSRQDFSGAAGSAYHTSYEQHVSRSVKTAHHGKVTAVAYAPDGKRIISAGTDDVMRCWDLQREGINTLVHYTDFENPFKHRKSWMLPVEPSKMQSAVVMHPVRRRSSQGEAVGNGSIDGDIAVYDMLGGHRYRTLEAHWEPSNCACVVDNGGDIEVLTGGSDGMICRWRFDRGKSSISMEKIGSAGTQNPSSSSRMARVWGGGGSSNGSSTSGNARSSQNMEAQNPDVDAWSDTSSEDEFNYQNSY